MLLEKLRSFFDWLVLQKKLIRLEWVEARLLTNLTAAGGNSAETPPGEQVSPEDVRQAFQGVLNMLMANALRRNRGEFDLDAIGYEDPEYVKLLVYGRVVERLDQPAYVNALKVFLMDYARAFGAASAVAIKRARAFKTEGVNHHGHLFH